CRGQLRVATFDRAATYQRRELVAKNVFDAGPGEAGYIHGPAIHAPRNPSGVWTLTLHISSPRDSDPVGDFEPLPALEAARPEPEDPARHPSTWVHRARRARQEADVAARILLSSGAATRELLARCAGLASSTMRP